MEKVVAIFSAFLVVVGFFVVPFSYTIKGYREAEQNGELPLVKAFISSIIGYILGLVIVSLILYSIEFLGYPVRYYVCIFFENPTYCQSNFSGGQNNVYEYPDPLLTD